MRAAKETLRIADGDTVAHSSVTLRQMAEIIDRETHTPALVEALREAITDEGANCWDHGVRGLARRLDSISEAARAALALVEGGEA